MQSNKLVKQVKLQIVNLKTAEVKVSDPVELERIAEPTPADEILAQSIRISINGDSFEVFCQNLSSVT